MKHKIITNNNKTQKFLNASKRIEKVADRFAQINIFNLNQ